MTKTDITNELNEYKKAGVIIWTANAKRAMPTGMRYFPDHHLILPNGHIFYLEVKLGSDTMSPGQENIMERIIYASMNNHKLHYCLLTDRKSLDKLKSIIDKLLT